MVCSQLLRGLFDRVLHSPRRFKIGLGIIVLLFAFGFTSFTADPVIAACKDNASCRQATDGKRKYCDKKGAGTCVECLNNSHCGGNKICQRDRCVPKPKPKNPGTGSGTGTGTVDDGYVPSVDNIKCTTPRGLEGAETEIGCIPKDPAGFAAEYYTYGLGMIGGLSILFIIFGGYIMLTSQGNPLRIQNGKTYIFYAVFGLLLAIFGYVFIEVILVDILKVPGFSR